jgi:hypothetical protein
MLRWSLKDSVKRTWTSTAISTNESAWSSRALSLVCEVAPSLEVGTYHFICIGFPTSNTQFTSSQSMQSHSLTTWKLGLTTSHKGPSRQSHFSLGQPLQPHMLRVWKLGLTTSYKIPSHKSPFTWGQSMQSKPSRYGSWDLPLQTWF